MERLACVNVEASSARASAFKTHGKNADAEYTKVIEETRQANTHIHLRITLLKPFLKIEEVFIVSFEMNSIDKVEWNNRLNLFLSRNPKLITQITQNKYLDCEFCLSQFFMRFTEQQIQKFSIFINGVMDGSIQGCFVIDMTIDKLDINLKRPHLQIFITHRLSFVRM